jgi:hypothetical protein
LGQTISWPEEFFEEWMNRQVKIALWWTAAIFAFLGVIQVVHILNQPDSPTSTEVCTRSHIKDIPVTQLDGHIVMVPAERCDHYKIVEEDQ